VSEAQKDWIATLNACANCQAFVCYGADEAQAVIETVDIS
jgi:hypothetical protein